MYYFQDKYDNYGNELVGEESPGPVWLRALVGKTRVFQVSFNDAATKITDAELEHVKELPQLQHLFLDGTQVTDAGLQHLKGLAKLKIVRLDSTRVTDAGLRHFEGALQLEWLQLNGTKVTYEGVKKLQRALPNCEIQYRCDYP